MAGLGPFSPAGTLWTGGTSVVFTSRYPGDWVLRNDWYWRVIESRGLGPTFLDFVGGCFLREMAKYTEKNTFFRLALSLGTREVSSHFSYQVPLTLAGLSHFSPPVTLGTGETPSFQAPRYP